jgi:predicted transcriptional regulator
MTWRDDLRRLTEAIPAEEVADAIAECERAKALLWQRLQSSGPNGEAESLRYLKAEDVAELLDVDKTWVYRHRDQLGGVSLDGVVRFPEASLRRLPDRRRRS